MHCFYQIKLSGEKRLSPVRYRVANTVEEALDTFKHEAKHINRTLGFFKPELQPEILIWKGRPQTIHPCKDRLPDRIYAVGPRGGIQQHDESYK